MTTGQRIAEQRKKCGYSQFYVAEKLNVSRQAVSRWEMDAAAPDTYNLIALAELLGVTVEYIVFGRETVDKNNRTELTLVPQNGISLLNTILITLSVWVGAGILLYALLSVFTWWNESNTFIVLPYIVAPLPFALMGEKLRIWTHRKAVWLYFAGFLTSLFVAAVCFAAFEIYIVANMSRNTLEFVLFDGGGRVSFFFLGLVLIHMAVMFPIFRCHKINMLGRILTAVLSAPAIIFLGYGALELFGYGEFYINHWWWTAVCALLYFAVGLIHWLIVKKHAKNLDTAASDRV